MQTNALLIGEHSQGSLHLIRHLEVQRCECLFVTSYQEARSLLKFQAFDFVLSPIRLRNSSLFPLLNQLEGSHVSLFYFQVVEKGCWWLPALRLGRNCFGTYALRPSEFSTSLGEIMGEIQQGARSLAEYQSPVASSLRPSVVPSPWTSTIPVAAIPTGAMRTEGV